MEFLRRRLGLIVRCVVSLLAVAYVIHTYDWVEGLGQYPDDELLAGSWRAWFASSRRCSIVSWRWGLLLGVHDVKLRFWRVFELTMIGQFFSTVGVGATGGDVFKIFYVARAVPDRRTAVAFTVIVDRVIGLLALLFFGGVLASSKLALLFSESAYQGVHRHVLSLRDRRRGGFHCWPAGAVFFELGRFSSRWGATAAWRIAGKSSSPPTIARRARVGTNMLALIVTIPSHFAHHGDGLLRHAGDGSKHPDFLTFCAIVAIVNLLIALPVSISGIGIRELLFPMFLRPDRYSERQGRHVFAITYFALCTVWNVAGAPFYFLYRHETHTPPPNVDEVEPIFEQ